MGSCQGLWNTSWDNSYDFWVHDLGPSQQPTHRLTLFSLVWWRRVGGQKSARYSLKHLYFTLIAMQGLSNLSLFLTLTCEQIGINAFVKGGWCLHHLSVSLLAFISLLNSIFALLTLWKKRQISPGSSKETPRPEAMIQFSHPKTQAWQG